MPRHHAHPLLTFALLGALSLSACGTSNEDDNNTSATTPPGMTTTTPPANNASSNNATTPPQNNATANNTTTPPANTAANNTTTGNNTTANNTAGNTSAGMCMDVTVYLDEDGDGYGKEEGSMSACLKGGEQAEAGYAREAGDCADGDPIAHTGAEGVCGDNVDDNCDGEDEACPESQPANLDVPTWDCTGNAPANVYAFARYDDGKGYLKDGGCFVFFDGAKGSFYSQKVNVAPAQQDCTSRYGCVCPSKNGWESYDRRLYALTLSGAPEDCENLELVDHAGGSQPVSNSCRKYLYQLYNYEIPLSYVAGSMAALTKRLESFDTVEIACLRDAPHANLPFESLITTQIELNAGYTPK